MCDQLETRVLHCGLGSPREARHFVAEVLTSWGRESSLEAAQLMVSELVTNAVLHGHCSESTVTVKDFAGKVMITVTDPETASPSLTDTGPLVPGGHGMHIIAALANRWGVEPCSCGKSVWFEMSGAELS